MPVKSSKKQVKKAAGKKVQKAVKVTKKAVQKTQKGGKKAAAKKTAPKKAAKKVASKKTVTATVVKKQQRSFKVKLPNSEVYEGRFTGLTPYQAANKALSKYYRETKKAKSEIVFSIKESTRGSKRLVYHYNGHREKLKVPVEYVIKSGDESRVITKNFKNRLTKIKKNELSSLNLA
tara:strand:+ start:290 stop:820 length:531 start_codon:yes stop_codon:yes gene_type:complete